MRKPLIVIGIVSVVLLVLLASVGGWAYTKYFSTKPLTEQELQELDIDWDAAFGGNWSPWWDPGSGEIVWNPVASFNDWMASIPDEDKAWPILIDAYYEHHLSLFKEHAYLEYSSALPNHPDRWAQWRQVIESDAFIDLSDRFAEACKRPVLGAELTYDTERFERAQINEYGYEEPMGEYPRAGEPSIIDVQLGWLGRLRTLATIQRSRAAFELEQGNPDTFVDQIESTHQLGAYAREFPVLISELVYIANAHQAIETIGWALEAHPEQFDADQLARLDRLLAYTTDFEINWHGERLSFYDSVRRMCDDSGHLSPDKIVAYEFSGTACSLPITQLGADAQRMLYVQHQSIGQGPAMISIPWDEQAESMEEILARERATLSRFGDITLDILIPSLDKAANRARIFKQEAIGLRLALASFRHRARHDAFPETIDAIDDGLLDFNPIDAFTGKQLGYTVQDGLPRVYSVGDDRVDDRGQPRWSYSDPDEQGKRRRLRVWTDWLETQQAQRVMQTDPESIRGDWVIFPILFSDPMPLVEEQDPDWDLKQDGMYNEESGATKAPDDGKDG